MKILFAYQYLSFKGGIEEVIINQAKHFKKNGFYVEILTSKFKKNEPIFTKDGVLINRIASINISYKMFGIPFAIPFVDPFNLIKIKKIIERFDVINIHGHPYFSSFVYMVIAKFLNKKVILTQHNTNIKSGSKIINAIYYLADKTIGKYNLNNADKIIAVSNETKKYIETLINNNNNKIKVVYNGVDIQRFKPTTNKILLRKKFNIPNNKLVCLTVRRLTFKNGIEMFLNVAKQSEKKDILFLLGGMGPDRTKIEKYINEKNISNVKLAGFITDKNLPSYYSLSDVFLLPSIQGEGFPMVVLESFASGIPVIATKSGGHVEVIKNNETGFLVEINDYKDMVEKIYLLKSNKILMNSMVKKVRDITVKNFSWEKNINKFINNLN